MKYSSNFLIEGWHFRIWKAVLISALGLCSTTAISDPNKLGVVFRATDGAMMLHFSIRNTGGADELLMQHRSDLARNWNVYLIEGTRCVDKKLQGLAKGAVSVPLKGPLGRWHRLPKDVRAILANARDGVSEIDFVALKANSTKKEPDWSEILQCGDFGSQID